MGEVSARMADPNYAQVAIGTFAQTHPDAGRYITAQSERLGGGEGVMHAVFHAQVLNECFSRHLGRAVAPIGFAALDAAALDAGASGDVVRRFADAQPSLASYVASNVDGDALRSVLALIGLAMSSAG